MKLSHKKYKLKANISDIWGGFKIATPEDTLDKIINDKCSISRLGDGEFDLILGTGIRYQKANLSRIFLQSRYIYLSNQSREHC